MDLNELVPLLEQLVKNLETALKPRPVDNTAIINSLRNHIWLFTFDPENGETFDRWYELWENEIILYGSTLTDAEKVRLVVSNLGKEEAKQFRNHISPQKLSDLSFDDAIAMLRDLFKDPRPLVRLRYNLLKTRFDGTDIQAYTALIDRRFHDAQWDKITFDQIKCLIWTVGLKSLDLELSALHELEMNPDLTLWELHDRLKPDILAHDDYIRRWEHQKKPMKPNSKSNSNKNKPSPDLIPGPPSPCFNCGEMHWRRDCTLPRATKCRNCKKTGHLAKVCRQKK